MTPDEITDRYNAAAKNWTDEDTRAIASDWQVVGDGIRDAVATFSSLNYTDADRYQWAAYYDDSSGSIRPVTVNEREAKDRQRQHLRSARFVIATVLILLGIFAMAWFGGSGRP